MQLQECQRRCEAPAMCTLDNRPDAETSALKNLQVPYSRLMHGLAQENIQVNRKVLSELAMHEPYSFQALVSQVRSFLWKTCEG